MHAEAFAEIIPPYPVYLAQVSLAKASEQCPVVQLAKIVLIPALRGVGARMDIRTVWYR